MIILHDMNESTQLMTKRIRRILLVCNNFDNFSLEEETAFIRHIALDNTLKICVDGRSGKAVVKLL